MYASEISWTSKSSDVNGGQIETKVISNMHVHMYVIVAALSCFLVSNSTAICQHGGSDEKYLS